MLFYLYKNSFIFFKLFFVCKKVDTMSDIKEIKIKCANLLTCCHANQSYVMDCVNNVPFNDVVAFGQLANLRRAYDEYKKYVEIYCGYINSK